MNESRWATLIITHYGGEALNACLRSIQQQTLQPDRCCVVVTNDTASEVSHSDTICLGKKAHYAEGVNAGLDALDGYQILILNDDTTLDVDCLKILHRYSDSETILQPQICLQSNPHQIDNIGHRVWPDGANFGHQRGQTIGHRPIDKLLVFSGAAFTLPPKVYRSVGKFETMLSPFGEDVDYSLRAIRRGWKIQSCPTALVYHKLGASYGRVTPQKIYWVERHRILLMLRSAPPALLMTMPISSLVRYALQLMGALKSRGSAPAPAPAFTRAIVRAYISAFRSSHHMINCRMEEQEEWKLSNREMLNHWRQQLPSLAELWHPPLESSFQPMEPKAPSSSY